MISARWLIAGAVALLMDMGTSKGSYSTVSVVTMNQAGEIVRVEGTEVVAGEDDKKK